jgi:hypothetical protein
MAFETDIWVHGVTFEARSPLDFPESLSLQQRTEAGAFFSTSGSVASHSFNVSVPSPTVLNDFRMRLRRVFIFYETNGATITSVRVFDGPRLVREFPNLAWSGSHSNAFDASNVLIINPSENISNGIWIVVEVDFDGQNFNKTIRFSSAGIQLLSGERLVSKIQWFFSLFEKREKRV